MYLADLIKERLLIIAKTETKLLQMQNNNFLLVPEMILRQFINYWKQQKSKYKPRDITVKREY